jgi:hypothetical protein
LVWALDLTFTSDNKKERHDCQDACRFSLSQGLW